MVSSEPRVHKVYHTKILKGGCEMVTKNCTIDFLWQVTSISRIDSRVTRVGCKVSKGDFNASRSKKQCHHDKKVLTNEWKLTKFMKMV